MWYHDEQNLYDLRQRITGQVRRHLTWSQLEIVWDNLSLQLKTIEDGLAKIDTIVGDVDWDRMPPSASGDGVPAYSTCCWSFATTSPPYTGCVSTRTPPSRTPTKAPCTGWSRG